MKTFSKGHFTVEVKDNLVISNPVGAFNESDIQRLRQAVLDAAKTKDTWIFLETPKSEAGLTPEAVTELACSYDIFHQNGCMAIGLEVGPTFGSLFSKPPFSELPIPIYTDTDPEKVKEKLLKHLANI
jgi:hypothetical protein